MNSLLSGCRWTIPVWLLALILPTCVGAQNISIKTVPVATGDQFLIYPSRSLAMGGVSIALDDTLLDPFINPAKGTRLQGTRFFGSTSLYSVSRQGSRGRTVPVGLMTGSGRWFAAGSIAMQQLHPAIPNDNWDGWTRPVTSGDLTDNVYASAVIARRPRDGQSSVGASFTWAKLKALDGVGLLYADSRDVEQFGTWFDCRLGLAGELDGDCTYELLVLRSSMDMTHNVDYGGSTRKNLDHTNTTGFHVGYVRPFEYDPDWRFGLALTLNVKSHPKIPEYELELFEQQTTMRAIPRDPGDTWAWNLGAGISKSVEGMTLGADIVLEPINSHTWGELEEGQLDYMGRWMPPGSATIDNYFKFANVIVRIGMSRENETEGLQVGLAMKSIGYQLVQNDNIRGRSREQWERWLELIPSWGVFKKFPECEIRYVGRITLGTGLPGYEERGDWISYGPRIPSFFQGGSLVTDPSGPGSYMVAPMGSLTVRETPVLTHQFTITIPIR